MGELEAVPAAAGSGDVLEIPAASGTVASDQFAHAVARAVTAAGPSPRW